MTDENNAKILAVLAWWNLSQRGNDIHFRFVHKKEQRPKEKVREKKYFCSLCGKAFLCPSSLAMHCRTHSGDKPFSCEQCGQAFAQAGNLKKHTKRWHENGEGRAPRYVCWPLLLPRLQANKTVPITLRWYSQFQNGCCFCVHLSLTFQRIF